MMRGFAILAVACLALGAPLFGHSPRASGGRQSTASESAWQLGGSFVFSANLSAETSSPGVQAQAPPPVVREAGKLVLNQPVERELGPGQTDAFTVEASPGQFLHVVVEKAGIDVVVVLADPEGRPLVTADGPPYRAFGPQTASVVTESGGAYQIRVAKSPRTSETGHYRIELTDLHTPTEQDRTRIQAETEFYAAVLNERARDKQRRLQAIGGYQRAAAIWRSLRNVDEEALCLHRIGTINRVLGELQEALKYLNQALLLWRTAGDRAGEAMTLTAVGIVYAGLGEMQNALDYYNRAVPLERAAGDAAGEALTSDALGIVYHVLGDEQKALDYYNRALALARVLGDRQREADVLSAMGLSTRDLGENQKALDYFNQALPLCRALGDRDGEGAVLNNIGFVYRELGDFQKALEYFNQALPLYRAVGYRVGEANALYNVGFAYTELGDKQKALDNFTQALAVFRALGDRGGEGMTLSIMGYYYGRLGDKQKDLDYCNQALPLERAAGDRETEAWTLEDIGEAYADLGEKQKALGYYVQTLQLGREMSDPSLQGSVLRDLMTYWQTEHNQGLAIFFGKQAVNQYQQIRRGLQGADRQLQSTYLATVSDDYRRLADLLVSQGRLPEALQVLDMLKIEEYSEYTRHRGKSSSETSPVAYTPVEENAKEGYERAAAPAMADGREWMELHDRPSRTPSEQKRYDELSAKLTTDNLQFQTFLNNLYNSFGKGDQANARVETINEQTAGLQSLVGELGVRTAAVYTLVLDDKCVMMVITPATRVAREAPISKIALRGKVFAFAQALAGHGSEQDIQAKAQDLYNVLIAPVEKDLQGAQAKTLVWSLDDVLRYVPLAALYDGKQYLVERYRNVVITTSSVGNLKDKPQVGSWRGAAMGVSKDYDGLGELKAVPDELDSVVRSDNLPGSHGPLPGTILLDDSFTETGMESALDQHPPLVHIASHYVFHVGDDTKSYLLLGGKETGGQGFHLTLADLRDDQRMDFQGIELLTLSGCQTAVGSKDSDGREIDGLGITAQRKGAKAVVATLWAVDDASVGLLMATFYKLWVTTPGITKVEALQQAQLALLHGTANPAGTSGGSAASGSKEHPASQYANPYYWAPFILIGNWK
jgi:CHAT domain-containing protein/Tfp pilus assembly protein PilF